VNRRWTILTALVLAAACSTSQPPPPQSPTPTEPSTSASGKRDVTPRAKLPPALLPLLPKNGIYASGGGLTSPPWRIVVDLDAKTIFVGQSTKPNAPSTGKLEKEAIKELSARNGAYLMGFAHTAWTEAPPTTPPEPTADYDEVLVVLEGDDTFYLEGYGPIRRPEAAKTIVELRAAAGL
jgi:hypothetical protein